MKLRHLVILGAASIFLASCGGVLVTATPAPSAMESPSSLPLLATPTALPTSTTAPVHTLTVCAGTEPADLYLYNELSYSKKTILSTIYDGPVDVSGYDYRPVILEKLPSLADGDALIEVVDVKENDPVVDNTGLLANLQPGLVVRPAGCHSSSCAVPYASGTIQMERMRVTFHIKQGIMWNDGAPLTADDSVYSYQVAANEATLFSNNGLVSENVQSVMYTAGYVAVDSHTTKWTGLPGFQDPNYPVNFFIPLPKHQLSAYSVDQLAGANEVLYAPLGWGPYQIVNWEHGKQIDLQPNPNYYRLGEGLPYYNSLVIRFIGQNYENNLQEFNNGACDILLQDALPEFPDAAIRDLVSSGTAKLSLDPQPVFEHLTFNFDPASAETPAYFSDLVVRQAAALCIDRTRLTNLVYAGLVPPLDSALPPDHPLLAGLTVSKFSYDPNFAALLLDNAGWVDTNGDGHREAKGVPGVTDGQSLTVSLVASDSAIRNEISASVSGQLEACGFQVTLVQAAARDLLAQNAEALLSGRHFDLALGSSPIGVESLCNLASTADISAEANGWSGDNLGGYSNPDFDAACVAVRSSLPGTPEYTTSRQSALLIFAEQLPVFPLFSYSHFTLIRPDLQGVIVGFGQASELQNVESIHPGP
jgi:peptide/nickel transport system substrate-binding protein